LIDLDIHQVILLGSWPCGAQKGVQDKNCKFIRSPPHGFHNHLIHLISLIQNSSGKIIHISDKFIGQLGLLKAEHKVYL